MGDSSIVNTVACDTAEEFFGGLSMNGPFFSGSGIQEWCFRGHSCAAHELVPTVLRSDNWSYLYRLVHGVDWLRESPPLELEQVIVECMLLWRFIGAANEAGLPIPGMSLDEWRNLWRFLEAFNKLRLRLGPGEKLTPESVTWMDWFFREWPLTEWFSALAVARHAGLPTRLLDWTFSPQIAAYFAASAAIENIEIGRTERACCARFGNADHQLDVWAVNTAALSRERGNHNSASEMQFKNRVEFTRCATADSKNMLAQRGLFSVVQVPLNALQNDIKVDRRPLDVAISEEISPSDVPILHRFSLPTAQAKRLLYMLYKDGYKAGTLFPSYEGSVREVVEFTRIHGRDDEQQ